jgi:hypothetical protein
MELTPQQKAAQTRRERTARKNESYKKERTERELIHDNLMKIVSGDEATTSERLEALKLLVMMNQ